MLHSRSLSSGVLAAGVALASGSGLAGDAPRERQLASSALHHVLDNNDNFSRDGRFLCFDTRDALGQGPANSTRLLKVELGTGEETVVYAPHPVTVSDTAPAPPAGGDFRQIFLAEFPDRDRNGIANCRSH